MTTNPPIVPLRELQSFSWSDWDSVGRAKNAIRALEGGVFTSAAQLCDSMRRDDRVSGCLLARTEALPSLPRKIEPREEGKREDIALELEAGFERMFPRAAVSELIGWGLLLGIGIAQNVWTYADGRWEPRLEVWHPQFLSWRNDTRSLWVQTTTGQVEVVPGDPRWTIYTPYGMDRPWMGGLVRSLYVPWLMRQFGMRDWARWSEVFGSPMRKAYFPTNAKEEAKQRFVREAARLGTETVIALARGATEQDSFDVELMEATGIGFEGFDRLLASQNTNIAVRILGQNLTTEVQGGSYAAAAVHGNIRNDILKGDCGGFAACLSEQPIAQWVELNFGDRSLAPKLAWHTDPPEDKKSGADAIASLGSSIKALSDLGVPVDTNALAKRFDIPLREDATEEDRRIAGQIYAYHLEAGVVTVNEVRQRLGLEPLPDEEGNVLVKSSPAPAPVPANEDDPKKRPPPFPPGKQKVAQASVLSSGPDPLLLGQLYADELADHAAKDGAQAVKPEVLALLDAVNGATDYDDLRERLKGISSNPHALAMVMEKALILAELNGRLAVLEGL